MALKTSQRTYKHQMLQELRERGELDTQIYGKIQNSMAAVKKQEVEPRAFPSKAEEMKRPEHALNIGNPLYQTSSMSYGDKNPAAADIPTKFFPRPEAFTSTFLGGQFHDTGLNTVSTKKRLPSYADP